MAAAVASVVNAEHPSEVVVGIPLGLHGGDTDQTAAARRFASALRAQLAVPVTEWDERLTTREASRLVSGRDRRKAGDLDSAAAALLLQAVLDARRGVHPS
jgi:putative Holliday junction resolvase